jgi:hypothetical protein
VKKIGKKGGQKYEYAYLVENKWRKRLGKGRRGSRQKVSKYLGRVLRFEKIKDAAFLGFLNIANFEEYTKKTKREIIGDLVRYELFLRGFEIKENLAEKEGVIFDFKKLKVFDSSMDERIVIEMNEGFLCNYTIGKLPNFKPEDDDEHIVGIKLAKAFLEAGLNVPKEIFVDYFGKI